MFYKMGLKCQFYWESLIYNTIFKYQIMFYRYVLALFLILPSFGFSQYSINNNTDGSVSVLMRGSIGSTPDFDNLNSLLQALSQNVTKELINHNYVVSNEKVIINNDNTIEITLKLHKPNNTTVRSIEVRYSAIFTTDVYFLRGSKSDNPKGDAINNFRFARTPELINGASSYKIESNIT